MQRMSGIATITHRFELTEDHSYKARLNGQPGKRPLPIFRLKEKWAVHDRWKASIIVLRSMNMVMLKDNHVDFAGGIRAVQSSEPDLISTQMNSCLRLKLKLEI